jgi:hypothetical protein
VLLLSGNGNSSVAGDSRVHFYTDGSAAGTLLQLRQPGELDFSGRTLL